MLSAGPAEEVRAFVKELDQESIFARTVDTNGVPYHSPALEPLLPELAACEQCLAQLPPLQSSRSHCMNE